VLVENKLELISGLFYPNASGSDMFDDSIPWTMLKAIKFHACGLITKPPLIVKVVPFLIASPIL
jgi:hypothetical protein